MDKPATWLLLVLTIGCILMQFRYLALVRASDRVAQAAGRAGRAGGPAERGNRSLVHLPLPATTAEAFAAHVAPRAHTRARTHARAHTRAHTRARAMPFHATRRATRQGLSMFDATYTVPVFQCWFISGAIIAGGV